MRTPNLHHNSSHSLIEYCLRLALFPCLIFLQIGTARAQTAPPAAGVIATWAGNGTAGYSGDGGAAIAAELNGPTGVALDAAGNIYIADLNNGVVRKINASTGIITTVAGNGTETYSGDGVQATSTGLNGPNDVVVDTSGNIYIADQWSNRIRKVTASTGIITTIAGNGIADYSGDGGMATNAALNGPTGLAVDGSGNLYIADYGNSRVRKVIASTGVITTVAGNGTAGYSGDGGLATNAELGYAYTVILDMAGSLYIVDYDENNIRKVTASTGIISTVAGNGTSGYSGDGGLATAAELSYPAGIAFDAAGNMYICDNGNAVIREVAASTGIITTVAGDGVTGFSGDGGLATNAELSDPGAIAFDAAGNLYIADYGNNRIRIVGASVIGSGGGTTPVITSVTPNPAGPSQIIKIFGIGFGQFQGSSTVTLNGSPLTPYSWSDTNITLVLPDKAVSGSLAIAVGGIASLPLNLSMGAGAPGTNCPVQPPQLAPGQLVAWALPSTATVVTQVPGATNGSAQATINSASLGMARSSPLGNWWWGATWSGFQVPTLPPGAVIQGIYAVGTTNASGSLATQVMTVGTDPLHGIGSLIYDDNDSIQGACYSANLMDVGITAASLPSTPLSAFLFQTELLFSFQKSFNISFAGFAIYYTVPPPPAGTLSLVDPYLLTLSSDNSIDSSVLVSSILVD